MAFAHLMIRLQVQKVEAMSPSVSSPPYPGPIHSTLLLKRWLAGKCPVPSSRDGRGASQLFTSNLSKNQPIRLPGLKPGVRSGLILSSASYPDLKIGVWRRRTYQSIIYIFFIYSQSIWAVFSTMVPHFSWPPAANHCWRSSSLSRWTPVNW